MLRGIIIFNILSRFLRNFDKEYDSIEFRITVSVTLQIAHTLRVMSARRLP